MGGGWVVVGGWGMGAGLPQSWEGAEAFYPIVASSIPKDEKGKERKGVERSGKGRKGKGKERKGKGRNGKERNGRDRKGKEKGTETTDDGKRL